MLSSQAAADEGIEQTWPMIWNYYKLDGVHSNRGVAKNVACTIVILLSQAALQIKPHIIGRAVTAVPGQKRLNVRACVQIREDDDHRYAHFTTPKVLNKEMMAEERLLNSSQVKQTVLE